MSDLRESARRWVAGDPDPVTRAELETILEGGDDGELVAAMGTSLVFGTAGLRGEVGPGTARMNRAVVIRTTWALATFVSDDVTGPVVVGFDARPSSKQFAADSIGVFLALGLDVAYFDEPTPTPLVAYAAKKLGASAAVVVTASHNPPQDNGYKVYGPDAAQIVSPVDTQIQTLIGQAPPASEIERTHFSLEDSATGAERVGKEILDSYVADILSLRPREDGSDLKIVYTPIHGVGWTVFESAMEAAGHHDLHPVPDQVKPDGTFPTVSFPNPEEPGALDLAQELGAAEGADLILANDPDADRLAVVVPHGGEWISLTGNEVGALLADYMLSRHPGDTTPIVASSIVSSPMMESIAGSYGAKYERTLTGFKWIMRAGLAMTEAGDGEFVFGYEEALGYTVGDIVRDKDGISASVIFADLAADLADVGESIIDGLANLWDRHGLWSSAQTSIVNDTPEGPEVLKAAVERVGESPPSSVGGYEVTSMVDYRVGADRRPVWLGSQDLIELVLGDSGRLLVRPSGTEPKLKIYSDLKSALGDTDVITARMDLQRRAKALSDELAAALDL